VCFCNCRQIFLECQIEGKKKKKKKIIKGPLFSLLSLFFLILGNFQNKKRHWTQLIQRARKQEAAPLGLSILMLAGGAGGDT